MTERKFSVVIPARLESQRLPKKLMLAETGKPLIVHTLENINALSQLAKIYCVTDSKEIADAVEGKCDKVYFSTKECASGTERICNILDNIDTEWVLNVQADEPEINIEDLKKLIKICENDPQTFEMATVGSKFNNEETFNNPNAVKVLVNNKDRALYFSRSAIPYGGTYNTNKMFHHLGIYAYRKTLLEQWESLSKGVLEKVEKLEQLRALENSISIFVLGIPCAHKGIDTREDYEAFTKRNKNK